MYRSVLHTYTISESYGAPSIAKRSYSSHMVAMVPHLLQRDGRSSGYPDGLLLARLLQIFFALFSNSFLHPLHHFQSLPAILWKWRFGLYYIQLFYLLVKAMLLFSPPPLLLFSLKGSIWSPMINIQLLTMDDRGTKWANRSNLLNGPLL